MVTSIFKNIYCFPVSERISTINKNSLASAIVGRKLKQVKTIKASNLPLSLKLIDGEIWCCQEDGVSVFDTKLTPVRRMNTGYTHDVALLPGGNIVIVVGSLREMSKSGTEKLSLKTFNTVQ